MPMFIVLRRFTMLLTIALEFCVFHKRHDWQVCLPRPHFGTYLCPLALWHLSVPALTLAAFCALPCASLCPLVLWQQSVPCSCRQPVAAVGSITATFQVLASISVMVAGAVIAAATDLSFNAAGYFAVIINDFFTAGYLVMLKHFTPTKGMDSFSILFYNSLISVVPLLAATWALGDLQRIRAFDFSAGVPLQLTMAAAVSLGVTINHSTYVCTRANEPLTTSVAGSFKNILMTGVGMMAFGDYVFDSANLLGIAVSMIGAVWYAYYGAVKAADNK